MSDALSQYELPLFPLKAVLFPGGVVRLRVFEARYLDLMTACIKTDAPFGVLHIHKGAEIHSTGDSTPQLDKVGCLARLMQWDMDQPGLMSITVRGLHRFTVLSSKPQANGLIVAKVSDMMADEAQLIPQQYESVANGLRHLLNKLEEQESAQPLFIKPYQFNDSAWVSNRWCEVLPIPTSAKQKLMELPDAQARLEIIASFLKQRGIA